MPKNPLKFARRKSLASGNVLDDFPAEPAAPATSSFRVLERPDKINLNGADRRTSADRLKQVPRPFNSPLSQLRGRSVEELSANRCVEIVEKRSGNAILNGSRGSGGTTNSGSSGYIDSCSASARHSSSSTLPSSVDAEREPERDELFPRKSKTTPMFHNVPASGNDPLPPPPSFSSRAARAFSFGGKNRQHGPETNDVPPMPVNRPQQSHSPTQRERAETASSYASTAVPTKPNLDLNLGNSDFSSDFSNMFDTPKHDKFDDLPPPPPKAAFHRTESEPMFPPRSYSRQAFKHHPEELKNLRDQTGSPYSLESRDSNEGLISSSALSSPKLTDDAPAPPAHGSKLAGIAPALLGKAKAGYSLVPDSHSPNHERMSQDSQTGFFANKNGAYDSRPSPGGERDVHDAQDADSYSSQSSHSESSRSATITRKPMNGSAYGQQSTRTPYSMAPQAIAGASRARAMSPDGSEGNGDLWESRNTTPRAGRVGLARDDNAPIFDSSPAGPPSRAMPPQHMRTESGQLKKMTKEQYEHLQRGQNSSADQSDEEDMSAEEYDDEDDAERAKRVARQRQKQEANMAVYRQQMKKVTGGGPADLPSAARPNLDRAPATAPAAGMLHLSGIGGQPPPASVRGKQTEDDDDEVPLGILQAHGFPGAGRPPTRQGDDAAGQKRMSSAASVVGGGAGQGNLPPFARRLPADPYFGSSVVNPSQRESLGMSSAQSVYGGMTPGAPMPMMQPQQPQMGHPGGLIGVIAGEERAKAARRGSPNTATGAFPSSNGMPNMPQMGGMMGMGAGRTMSMGNLAPPSVYTPSGMGPNGMIPPMPQMPQMYQMQQMQQMQQMPMQADLQQEQMKQFMQMQMQVMQNMLAMQQQQLGQTPPVQQQQSPDYLGVPLPGNRQFSMHQGAPSIRSQAPTNQGRAMTMMNPPKGWDVPPGAQRPNSAMPQTYAPSGYNVNVSGPGPGYSPSIAPTERSTVGQPSRYRPVTNGGDGTGRSQSMTSSLTLNAFTNQPQAPPQQPAAQQMGQLQPKSTVRMIDKPKGTPRATAKPAAADEDDEEGWAEMRKKRDDKKRFRFGRKDKTETSIGEIYQSYD
ncbi:hypothetical protein LTR37_021172 [Vermiconidia calcicola]|uniref:Uncharacterized protein n=1 Tax=Vermiconidia calcicola TaxID=1690605 RepID=A0ACC3M9K4_9PEZI|nr:hypothetical protein LTR37_021172 [Vermiconidia calcicola]